MNSKLAVVSCIWQRPERLPKTLDMLTGQTFPVDIYLVLNNPELEDLVDEVVEEYDSDNITVFYNEENRGPYARIEFMHSYSGMYDHFLTIDDDIDFDKNWALRWWQQRRDDAVQGANGFRFVGDYWTRVKARQGEDCHYLWGQNLMVPATAVMNSEILEMPAKYRLVADDLWMCFFANHEMRLRLLVGDGRVKPVVDGKDSYMGAHKAKIRFLEELREKGWAV